jgi:broad specificity phosphatase PhoE
MASLKLLFIRHAQSTGNVEKRMQGQGEFELTADGRQQAEKLAHRLFSENWHPTHVYSSPLKRTAQTTEILLSRFLAKPLPAIVNDLADGINGDDLDLPISIIDHPNPKKSITVEYADALKEHDNGIFEGLTWAEAKQRHPDLCSQLEKSPDWIQIPQAESLQDARDRVHHFIQKLLMQHQNGDRVWIITHSWILQHLVSELLGSDRSWRMHARNTALFEFWIDRDRWTTSDQNRYNTDLWQIRRFADSHHLR